ncbi:MAG: hypothetical protein ACOCP8_05155 [archaeon]
MFKGTLEQNKRKDIFLDRIKKMGFKKISKSECKLGIHFDFTKTFIFNERLTEHELVISFRNNGELKWQFYMDALRVKATYKYIFNLFLKYYMFHTQYAFYFINFNIYKGKTKKRYNDNAMILLSDDNISITTDFCMKADHEKIKNCPHFEKLLYHLENKKRIEKNKDIKPGIPCSINDLEIGDKVMKYHPEGDKPCKVVKKNQSTVSIEFKNGEVKRQVVTGTLYFPTEEQKNKYNFLQKENNKFKKISLF